MTMLRFNFYNISPRAEFLLCHMSEKQEPLRLLLFYFVILYYRDIMNENTLLRASSFVYINNDIRARVVYSCIVLKHSKLKE